MWGCLVCVGIRRPLHRLFQRRAPKSPVMIAVLLLGLFGISRAGDDSAPYQNDYYVTCASTHRNCAENKCVMFGPRTTLCTECKSGSVPINGTCIETNNNMQQDTSVCVSQSTDGNTRCSSCNDGSGVGSAGGSTYFLFYGGCYSKNDWPGTHICKTVSGGTCSECAVDHYYVFTNDASNQEKCILCGDTAGFDNKIGVAGCSSCIPLPTTSAPSNEATKAAVRCMSCADPTKAPIDDACTDPAGHDCQNGHCTHCAFTHVWYKGGCYDKSGTGASICDSSNLLDIGGYSACKQCVNSTEIPHNGNCKPTSKWGYCNKDNSTGRCTACDQNTPGSTVFFYEGGCYTTDDFLGGTICTKASAGKCTTCNEDNGYFKKDLTCARCDAYINNCAMCVLGTDTASNPMCTGCRGNTYANIEGTSCVSSCPPETPGRCGESGICRCECGTGTYFDTASTSCKPCNQICLHCKGPGSDECVSCAQDKYMKISTSGTLTCVDADGCGEGSYPDNDSHVCAPCNINLCRICNSGSAGIKCTECSSGYLSLDGSSCSSQCTGQNQREGDNNKCVCVDGFRPDDSGTCVATNTCPP
ncbi:Hypothetical protein GSB_151099 [Giardia duodenalis]|uniref:EGF-like domain-containing protein n=1 Tax=Giardia intestinalis TaxID=5741 RepID=V6TX46_GIAIN|nr:Hypothetical protein GSB_151099 [Giardia intestinalis]